MFMDINSIQTQFELNRSYCYNETTKYTLMKSCLRPQFCC